ncbi:MAG: 16S rRNA (cytosine(1402)-N(4))-methyltransferase RsmH [Candidatus Pacebacteria bacterium]|nr:16S rRNA (cytosine(1402)-N(4))-methyltransferase RsmH [Candidatus Paceibacterota bacterium]
MHIPVLKKEVLEQIEKNNNYIDTTFGQGGHGKEILQKILPKGKLLAIERDEVLYQQGLKMRLPGLILYNDSYSRIKEIVQETNFVNITGILFDLGFCTFHIKESKRGFSFLNDESLDMRYSSKDSLTAKKIVNQWRLEDIEKILKDYGEEKYAKKIALSIIKQRKEKEIQTTFDLIQVIKKAVPYQKSKIHFATRTFQALRIAVNNELDNLQKGLEQAYKILDKKGKIMVISFHSLEDRIVKNFFKKSYLILPSQEEIKNNKLARSAKLRIGIKT